MMRRNQPLYRRLWIVSPLILGVAVSIGLLTIVTADGLRNPRRTDHHVSKIVSTLLNGEHLSKHQLDDEISTRALKAFIKTLDPMKLYFHQGDVDEFSAFSKSIDDQVKSGDIGLSHKIFTRLLKRIDERVAMVDELLKTDMDFTRQEVMVTDPDERHYAKDDAEANDFWRQRLKYDLLVLKADKKEGEEAREKLRRRYRSFSKRMHQTNNDELLEMYLTAVTTSFDPHTTYMSPSTLENFEIIMSLHLEGIGAALQVEDGYTVVSKVIPGGAADKHGKLKPEDRIVSVGTSDGSEMVDVVDMKLGDVVKLIRGKRGTKVRLGVIPAGESETVVYTITRAKIELTDSEARGVIFEEGKKTSGAPYKIGVIELPSFYMDMKAAREGRQDYKSTTRDVRRILEDFKSKGVDAVVLDLRRNGGGSLTESINLTGLFIDTGPVVQVKDPASHVQHYDDMNPGMSWNGPLVVLTSKFSASASEILAGAIKDYRRGIIVGDKATHGKGTVQSLLNLGEQLFANIPNPPNLGALKITMQQFYRPNGESTQRHGVATDIALPSVSTHMDIGEADLDYAIKFDRIPRVEFKQYRMTSKELVDQLSENSEKRRQVTDDFRKLNSNIERYLKQKARKSVSLVEEEYFARIKELDAQREEEKQLENQEKSEDEVVKRDFYFDEVINITVDYIRMLGQNSVARR